MDRKNDYYFLGFAFEDSTFEDDKLIIKKKKVHYNRQLSEVANKLAIKDKTRFTYNDQTVTMAISDSDTVKLFGETTKKMLAIPEEYIWSFIAGYFDAYGSFRAGSIDGASATVFSSKPFVIDFMSKHWKARTHRIDRISTYGYKALDICGKMYANCDFKNSQNYNTFWDCLNWNPKDDWHKREVFRYMKLDSKAVPPSKDRVTDSGYDIHAVELEKCYGNVYKADTKLAIKPAPGFYFDLHGRSSLPTNGWQFLQGVGVVDRSYTGNVGVVIFNHD